MDRLFSSASAPAGGRRPYNPMAMQQRRHAPEREEAHAPSSPDTSIYCSASSEGYDEALASDLECPIDSTLLLTAMTTQCGHSFNKNSIETWQAKHADGQAPCPCCMQPILTLSVNTTKRAQAQLLKEQREGLAPLTDAYTSLHLGSAATTARSCPNSPSPCPAVPEALAAAPAPQWMHSFFPPDLSANPALPAPRAPHAAQGLLPPRQRVAAAGPQVFPAVEELRLVDRLRAEGPGMLVSPPSRLPPFKAPTVRPWEEAEQAILREINCGAFYRAKMKLAQLTGKYANGVASHELRAWNIMLSRTLSHLRAINPGNNVLDGALLWALINTNSPFFDPRNTAWCTANP